MELNNVQDDESESLPVEASRLSTLTDSVGFVKTLEALQVPCPWGDLTKGEGMTKFNDPELNQIPYVPLALALGAGRSPMLEAYQSASTADKFGKIIYSDVHDPRMAPRDYLKLDLTDPKSINLFGYKVHALISIAVFTYDELGVNFKDDENELEAATALNEMLMPGGIIASVNVYQYDKRFEDIFIEKFGYKIVKLKPSIILQKPFVKS